MSDIVVDRYRKRIEDALQSDLVNIAGKQPINLVHGLRWMILRHTVSSHAPILLGRQVGIFAGVRGILNLEECMGCEIAPLGEGQ